MNAPVKITYRHLDSSEALNEKIREHTRQLDEVFDGVVEWRVVIEAPHRHLHAHHFQVHLVAVVPGTELVISDDAPVHARENPYLVVAEAFHAMKRRLQDYAELRRREVKAHSLPTG